MRTFTDELREFIERHGLRWQGGEKPLKRLSLQLGRLGHTGLKAGVNEKRTGLPAGRYIRVCRKLLLHQIQHRRGHRHHSSANRWFRHGREFARM